MAGGLRTVGGGIIAEPNVLPMIDVLLVMIVTAMLLLRERHLIPTQVPPPASGGPGGTQIVLEIRADGSFALNAQAVPDGSLETVIQAVYQGRPNRLLFIDAASNRPYQEVITAMDRARGAGIQVIALVPKRR